MKNKKGYIAIVISYEIMYLTLRYILSIHWVISIIISSLIVLSVAYLDAEYYFLPTEYRKSMKTTDEIIKKLDRQIEELEN